VIVGAEAHATIWRSLAFLGIGSAQVRVVDVDEQGGIRPGVVADALATLVPGTRAIVCA
jgi:glutamate/tyrosine decarboxylase-like PLP-dependent enzyme